jgi:DNA (cytosine-5)-methyltransferase 1
MIKDLSFISLYSGAGGLDIGLEAAGFSTRLCVEIDESCKKTLRANRPEWQLSQPGDILQLSPKQILEQSGLKPGEVTLIAGGPPCQPFSHSGSWANGGGLRLKDPRAQTLNAFLKLVEHALPEVVLIENVKGLVFRNKDEAWVLIQSSFTEINKKAGTSYNPQLLRLNAASYGVPQLRERVFIIAQREGKSFSEPSPTHTPAVNGQKQDGLQSYMTAWDAIGDLEEQFDKGLIPRGKWADLLPSIPEGGNYLWHTSRGGGEPLFGWRTRYWTFLLKLSKQLPSWTIQAVPGPSTGPFHWNNRHLSVRELCRIQTFPDDYEIFGGYRDGHRQVGNAVPPGLGELLGLEIRRQLLGSTNLRSQLMLIPASKDCCPSPEQHLSVPDKYLPLRGKHTDHPGTGLGPGALAREKQVKEIS